MPRRSLLRLTLPALLGASVLAGCGRDPEAATDRQAAAAPLPQPQQAPGSITDMPTEPGPGDVPLAGTAPRPAPVLLPADENFGLPPLEDNPETGLGIPGEAATIPEPTTADAVATLQAYYAAIDARSFVEARALWSDDGRGSGQTPEPFAAGFADTVRIELAPGVPGAVEAAAGSRYVAIPVTVAATLRDGSVRRYGGHYTLRRAVVDGATPEQRAWRIASAELHDAAP